jgi:hypothetical protein
MIKPVELSSSLDSKDILEILDHTDDRVVSGFIGTNMTDVKVADVMADGAMLDVMPEPDDAFRHFIHFSRLTFQKVEHQPQSSLASDAR